MTLGDTITFKKAFKALRDLTQAMITHLAVATEQPKQVTAVEALGVARWVNSDAALSEALDGCDTLANVYHRLHMLQVGRDFQVLADQVRQKSGEVLQQLGATKFDEGGVSKKFWQHICGGKGMFSEIIGNRPLLRTLAKVCLTVSTVSCPVERFFSAVKLATGERAGAWSPTTLLRQLRLQLEAASHVDYDVREAVQVYKTVRSKVNGRKYWRKEGKGRKGAPKRIRTYDGTVYTDPQELVSMLLEEIEEGGDGDGEVADGGESE